MLKNNEKQIINMATIGTTNFMPPPPFFRISFMDKPYIIIKPTMIYKNSIPTETYTKSNIFKPVPSLLLSTEKINFSNPPKVTR